MPTTTTTKVSSSSTGSSSRRSSSLHDDDDHDNRHPPGHERLRRRPLLWATVGVTQTLLTAGIVFGWASLLPVLREEGVEHTPQDFSKIFTCDAVGNYLSTICFGITLDRYGPKVTAIVASLLFTVGLLLCCQSDSFLTLLVGFGLLGFAGPGIQMPTLHLANLFPGAVYMSAQAAAFDGGTAVFALVRLAHQASGLSTTWFFALYTVVPLWVLVTAAWAWPTESLPEPPPPFPSTPRSSSAAYVGAGSPYLSPRPRNNNNNNSNNNLVNAPLSVVLSHVSFWTLAIWVSVHILKLNFVVATINDQLNQVVGVEQADSLIDVFGAMLPFGFLALPVVAWLLQLDTISWALQVANVVGLAYGAILVWAPSKVWWLRLLVFPAVATSRQLVYSTVFSQLGTAFGFVNYGVLLGVTNILVSTFSLLQNPLVHWSEAQSDYTQANAVLLALTVPLLAAGWLAQPSDKTTTTRRAGTPETSLLLGNSNSTSEDRKPRSCSTA